MVSPAHAGQRPAFGPGEDRNSSPGATSAACSSAQRPAFGPGEDRNSSAVTRTAGTSGRQRPAFGPGEDRNTTRLIALAAALDPAAPGLRAGRGSQPSTALPTRCGTGSSSARPSGRARIATVPSASGGVCPLTAAPGLRAGRGSQQDVTVSPRLAVIPGAAPGLRAGRGSQQRRAALVPWRHHRAAPGLRAGRGSQPPPIYQYDIRSACSARPSGRARIATPWLPMDSAASAMQRPAFGPGEDRNVGQPHDRAPRRAAPGLRAGRGSQRGQSRPPCSPVPWQRPAFGPGEDRNSQSTISTR